MGLIVAVTCLSLSTYHDRKTSVTTSTLMKMAKTIQYIIHLVCRVYKQINSQIYSDDDHVCVCVLE